MPTPRHEVQGPVLPTGTHAAISGREALRRAMSNRFRKFMYVDGNQIENAGNRIREDDIVNASVNPKFQLSRGAKVFTIGSCFARNVEDKLISHGVNVASRGFSLPREYYYKPSMHGPRTALNKYSPHSIAFELDRVISGRSLENDGFVQVDDSLWYDPHCSQVVPRPLEDCREVRAKVAGVTREIEDCDFVFVTLGLTETWIDNELNVPVNLPPKPNLLKRFPDRFGFSNATYPSVVEALESTIDLVCKQCNREMKFIFTVSPVPLQTTYSDVDVILANTYSKSVLRAACGHLSAMHDNVDYFPSFEMLMYSNRRLVWREDEVHIKNSAVGTVIQRFANSYLED
ncbi:GSCFA family protein [Rubripirellula lacrimiformis]|uniref:GSCFA family protein n=1 Tax=Rubripirellula lacrimiformis TaxID=1930273 RepID=A0A517NIR9_9BACT|nr:GSCFA domain-containing protein [Rubripirellula lacrimiformis]QDT07030.1 GSCFA family protein [Rubripirellula lacrimiformis]